ncbi:MAG: DUF1616 domain-containing protein [Oscillospiraceae bacterium]|jgi:uncharacterized membrane protein
MIALKKEYLIIGFIILSFSFAAFNTSIRAVILIPYALVLPGYLVTAVLFPKADRLNGLARLGLSFGLSIIIVPLIGLLNNYIWGVQLLPVLISLTVFNLLFAVLGWAFRKRIPEKERFLFRISIKKWLEKPKSTKIICLSVLITALLVFGTAVYTISVPKNFESFTEFYIIGQHGLASDYPTGLQAGQYGSVGLVIKSSEHKETTYRIEIKADGELIGLIEPIRLKHLEMWTDTVNFKFDKPGEKLKLEFLLYKSGYYSAPYRNLRLYVDVK